MDVKKINCVVLDDEQLALDLIESHINRHESLSLLAKFNNSVEAIEKIDSLQPDVLFIDVQMPGLNGFEVIEALHNPPLIVMTTAYDNYAVEAFELDIFDYLLKPVTVARFDKTVVKIVQHFKETKLTQSMELNDQEIFIKVDRALIKINVKDIYYVQGLQKYVKICTSKGMYVTLISMGKMIKFLSPYRFYHCHKSYIINLDFLEKLEGRTAFIQGVEIPVSKSKKKELIEVLRKI